MGGALSSRPMQCNNTNNPTPDSRSSRRQSQPINRLLMYNGWRANDLVYEYVISKRERLEEEETGSALRIVAKFSPCKVSNCKCKGGTFKGVKRDTFGWKNSNCSGCNHQISDHARHVESASTLEFTSLIKLIFDIINIKGTLENVSKKHKLERNILLEDIFQSVYNVLIKNVRLDPFTAPNIDTIYGSPPFERTEINQILLNFTMLIYDDDNILELKNALILTKFVIRYFDTWMWAITKEQQNYNSREYSKSYNYYYRRFLVYCCLPRCVHSISLRYRASKIFGRDVLKYTLKAFRIELEVWCYKQNIMWTEHTKLFCLNYLPIYMDLLEKEVFSEKSLIWNMDYKLSDIKRKTHFLEYS